MKVDLMPRRRWIRLAFPPRIWSKVLVGLVGFVLGVLFRAWIEVVFLHP